MSRENYDNYDQDERIYHAADDSINSELMEKKDPAINQHETDSTGIHSDTFENHETNSRDEDDFDNDANRRTLDEEKAVEDEDEDN
ncbi:hypothetical protein ASE21_00635 [Flavobacterium sp. Root901]|uniref:hypothetical protein n=1 Tax=Flavobacterium sp. Root901 TaxID=1736605 RepID=UPI00070D425F|nr:hypothetical protein [Flavobacterium sp. Root901]KRD12452.1 hypothetical protein ASE21_00635 [Flavobacterium sp. Root901]